MSGKDLVKRPESENGSRLVRGGTARLICLLTVACLAGSCGTGEDPPPHSQQPSKNEASDVLGLRRCNAPIGDWASPIELPALPGDDWEQHAAHCGFRALDGVLEGKRIFCSGENDHGVADSFHWHAAFARYLIHRAGVRVIAFEGTAAAVEHWNRYLITGDGNDLEAGYMDSIASLADVSEYKWLLTFLRRVQEELPEGERLRLTGFDVAVQSPATIQALVDFLERAAPDEVAVWNQRWSTDTVQAAMAAEELHSQLINFEVPYTEATDAYSWRAAKRDAANLRDGFYFQSHYMKGDFGTGNHTYREPGMIRNVEELAGGLSEGEGLLILSHNLHCAKNLAASGAVSPAQSPALGTHLAQSEKWGPKYFLLAQLYDQGTHRIQTTSGSAVETFQTNASSLSGALRGLTHAPALLLGAHAYEPKMDRQWDMQPMGTLPFPLTPAEQFDGLVWVRDVTATSLR